MAKWDRVRGKMGRPSRSDTELQGRRKYLRQEEEESPYGREMYKWGRRIRRDILLLERYLKDLEHYSSLKKPRIENKPQLADYIYGDPGDPPPPPTSF